MRLDLTDLGWEGWGPGPFEPSRLVSRLVRAGSLNLGIVQIAAWEYRRRFPFPEFISRMSSHPSSEWNIHKLHCDLLEFERIP